MEGWSECGRTGRNDRMFIVLQNNGDSRCDGISGLSLKKEFIISSQETTTFSNTGGSIKSKTILTYLWSVDEC